MTRSQIFSRVLVEKSVQSHQVTQKILNNIDCPVEYIDSLEILIKNYKEAGLPQEKILVLARQKGRFVNKCPGTMGHVCCNYYVIKNGINCIYDCSYCFLKFYANNPFLTIFVNREDLYKELDALIDEVPVLRVGSGEFTDSLALEHITGEAADLIGYFANKPAAVLELKTKSTNIEGLLQFKPEPNIVIGWSLNSDSIIKQEEHKAPGLEERLTAASRCEAHGYKVAFHFDPIIYFPGWEQEYKQVVDRLFMHIKPESLRWISLGSLRYNKELKLFISKNYPDSDIIYNETVNGMDEKVRYYKPVRVKLYRTVNSYIEGYTKGKVPIYLCMELPEVWIRAMGQYPDFANKNDCIFCR